MAQDTDTHTRTQFKQILQIPFLFKIHFEFAGYSTEYKLTTEARNEEKKQ